MDRILVINNIMRLASELQTAYGKVNLGEPDPVYVLYYFKGLGIEVERIKAAIREYKSMIAEYP
jgi:hypothetical protein